MFKIASGETSNEDWMDYDGGPGGINIDVNTSCAEFTSTPHYYVSLHGNGCQWRVNGVNAIYGATATGFRIYLAWSDNTEINNYTTQVIPNPLRANFAVQYGWYLKWTGIETCLCEND